MKIGLLTNSLVNEGLSNLDQIAEWAYAQGFEALELGPSIALDERSYGKIIDSGKIAISNLIYCRNFLSRQREEANMHLEELKRRIDFAGKFGIPVVVTSTGIDKVIEEGVYDRADAIRKIPERSLPLVIEKFLPVIELAELRNVRIAFENCPLMGNIAISPVLWAEIFSRFNSDKLGLAYDPSHLVWQFIEPYDLIIEFGNRIFHVHAKDTCIDRRELARRGILTDFKWWQYRMPGDGELDWQKITANLEKAGYSGFINIEHEDKNYAGSLDRVQKGLVQGMTYLKKISMARSII
jgi:sugar phosphate isomerase/epimerase